MVSVVLTEEYENNLKNQISNLIDIVVAEKVEKINPTKRYYTKNELQKFLKIGTTSMELLAKNGLHYVAVGNKYLFDIEEVYSIFENLKRR